jgi:cell division septation protein DedD
LPLGIDPQRRNGEWLPRRIGNWVIDIMGKKDSEIEVKIRVPKALMAKINDFRHSQKLDSKKEAIVYALDAFFSQEMRSEVEPDGKGADAPVETGAEHSEAAAAEPATSTGSSAEPAAVEPATDTAVEEPVTAVDHSAEEHAPHRARGARRSTSA